MVFDEKKRLSEGAPARARGSGNGYSVAIAISRRLRACGDGTRRHSSLTLPTPHPSATARTFISTVPQLEEAHHIVTVGILVMGTHPLGRARAIIMIVMGHIP